jgi:YHS domain-containing protein
MLRPALRPALRSIALAVAAAVVSVACRSTGEEARRIEARPGHAVCSVCRCTGDLGCMDVEVGPTTPHATYQGQTYWFCSCSCRDDFERDPAAYADASREVNR